VTVEFLVSVIDFVLQQTLTTSLFI